MFIRALHKGFHYFNLIFLQAFTRLSDGVSSDTDDYLDLSLVEEEDILAEYKRFLDM